jgi:hypothetical protein
VIGEVTEQGKGAKVIVFKRSAGRVTAEKTDTGSCSLNSKLQKYQKSE